MRLRSIRAWILPLAASVLSVIVITASLALRFLDLDTYKSEIVAQVRAALKRDLRYETGDFSLRYGPSFTFSGVTIKEKDGGSDFVTADRLTIRIALLPLLRRELVLARMQLERPVIRLARDREGVFNVSDLLTPAPGSPSAGIRGVKLDHARIVFSDRLPSDTPLVTELTDTDLYLSRLVRGKSCDFKLSGFLGPKKDAVPLFFAGVAKLPAAGTPFSNCEASGKLRTGPLPAAHFWPYYGRYLPFRSLAGELAIDASFKGRLTAFKGEVGLKITGLNLDYPQVFHARLTPKSVKGSCKLELNSRDLDIGAVKVTVDGLNLQGSCRLSDLHSGDLRITAKAALSRFRLADFRQFIPYGIIVQETADFIERKITGGYYQLEEGRLDGRVSQILHMERGINYNILSIRAKVDEGVVAYGAGIPAFEGLKGELLLAGKDFILRGMSGRFGATPLTLEGRIADYPLDTPSRYLFSALLHPRQPEAAWLLGHGRGGKLVLADGSTLKLAGEGTSSNYNLSGDWDLSAPAYSFPELIVKPQGHANTVSFKVNFGREQFQLSALHYNLAPLALSATVLSRYQGPVSLEVKTNQFQAAEVAALVPRAKKYQPAGRVQLQLQASGPGLDRLDWGGSIAVAGGSFRAGDKIRPVSGVNGSIRLSRDALESSQLTARIGGSVISGHGALSGFQSPSFSLTFASPSIDLADLGLPQGRQPLRVEKVQGSVTYGKESLQIASLSGTLGRSVLQVKGGVQNLLTHPQIELAVSSPHLELSDLLPLFAPSTGGGNRLTLKAHLTAAEGKVQEVPFQRLRCQLLLEDRVLTLQPLDFSSFDGEVSGKVRVDFSQGAPRYQTSCSLQRVSAERLLHAMGVEKQQLTGTLSLQGELSARGESGADWRKSAAGSVRLRVEHGSIRKFSTLSKVFSILNVSQLLKFHLPDMVSGGMPYNKITGDFAIKDGFTSTQNLLLDSNAINVSTVGRFDLVKNQLDLTIGVQPLQSVDKVVSRIPIVGWILTGKNHSLITTYFEAKGPIENPQVTAVPVKSLAKGVFNIFKRVFELPGRLITDTGEVIVGH